MEPCLIKSLLFFFLLGIGLLICVIVIINDNEPIHDKVIPSDPRLKAPNTDFLHKDPLRFKEIIEHKHKYSGEFLLQNYKFSIIY